MTIHRSIHPWHGVLSRVAAAILLAASVLILSAPVLVFAAPARQDATSAASALQESVSPEPPSASGRHIIPTPYADIEMSPIAAQPDGSLALKMTVRPHAGIHIYAPGQKGYYPIAVQFPPESRVTPGRLDLPPPEPYTFAPTGEWFLVYQEPFSLTQFVKAPASARDAIRAVLQYQACDDRACFRPEKIPVTWTREPARPSGDRRMP